MKVIPVIDVKDGHVVHARLGHRAFYRPIETPLAGGSDPVAVIGGLLALHPFGTIYVADLDAIAGTGDHRPVVARVQAAFPQLTLWVDAGIADIAVVAARLEQDACHLVLGSETQSDAAAVAHFSANPRIALSLDFRGAELQGPPALLTQVHLWPQRVIVMTLDRVGSHAGPDLDRLRAIKAAAGRRAVYAAGGVRDAADLHALAQNAITGALVASSLHDGRLTADDLRQVL